VSTLIVGCGYLGTRVGRQLALRGERVWGTVRSPARADALAARGIEPVIGDVLDRSSLRAWPAADRVFYAVGRDRSADVTMRTVYVDGLSQVLGELRARGVRLVYASTTGVYGQDDGGWVDEGAPTEPKHEAGQICLDAEGVARAWGERTGSPVVVVRFAGLYGPHRIPRRAAVERGESIAGAPSKFLNFIHVDDAASAAVAALDRGGAGRIYHASDGRPLTRLDAYTRLAERLNAPPPRFDAAGGDRSNKRVANQRLRSELRVELGYPDFVHGLTAVLSP
jgi:nucleoside-diphosphate-sugar epimerase